MHTHVFYDIHILFAMVDYGITSFCHPLFTFCLPCSLFTFCLPNKTKYIAVGNTHIQRDISLERRVVAGVDSYNLPWCHGYKRITEIQNLVEQGKQVTRQFLSLIHI